LFLSIELSKRDDACMEFASRRDMKAVLPAQAYTARDSGKKKKDLLFLQVKENQEDGSKAKKESQKDGLDRCVRSTTYLVHRTKHLSFLLRQSRHFSSAKSIGPRAQGAEENCFKDCLTDLLLLQLLCLFFSSIFIEKPEKK
jgi:hypothetical protein